MDLGALLELRLIQPGKPMQTDLLSVLTHNENECLNKYMLSNIVLT